MPHRPPATRDRVGINHLALAVCEVYVFRLCGTPQSGFSIDSKELKARDVEMLVECYASGVPIHPGANDKSIKFPNAAVFKTEVLFSFIIADAEIEKAFGMKLDQLHVESDGEHYEVTLAANGWPVGQIDITGWKLPPVVSAVIVQP